MQIKRSLVFPLLICFVVLIVMMCGACTLNQSANNTSSSTSDNAFNQGHTHTYSSEWYFDGSYHWHACSGCDVIKDKQEHDWNFGIVTSAPTETSEGTRVYSCNTCGHTKVESIPMLIHEHSYESGWTTDDSYHWHASACGHENEINGKAEHQWDNGVVIKAPSEAEAGTRLFSCIVCQKMKTEVIPALDHVHTFEEGWTTDEHYHWHASACGHENEISGKAEHIWDDGIVTKSPTETETGTLTYTCNVCDKTRTEEIPVLMHAHTFSNDWSYNDDYHWHAATCEHSFLRNDEESHNWIDTGKIITVATETEEGRIEQQCTVCGHFRTITVGTIGHIHTYADTWISDDDYHWRMATCGHDVISDKTPHDWDEGTIVKQATVDEEGLIEFTCSVCGITKEETVPESDSFIVVFLDQKGRPLSERRYLLGTDRNDIVVPTPASADGYRFVGWSDLVSSEFVTSFDFSQAEVNNSFRFIATYEKLYTVVFKDYQENTISSVVIGENNNSVSIDDCPPIPEREGYTSRWDPQTLCDINKDTTIVPIYERITFEVVFKDNLGNVISVEDGKGSSMSKQIVDYGSFAIAPDCAPYYFDKVAMRLYRFSGWSTSFDSVKENMEVVAQYGSIFEEPVIAIKIENNRLIVSLILPSNDTALFALDLSFIWTVDTGTCVISESPTIRAESPLDKDNSSSGKHTCAVGNKEDWISYNNKTHSLDFVWNCGYGHTPNNIHFIESILTVSFSVYDNAMFDSTIFSISDSSVVIYGNANDDISNLQRTKPMVWFYQ